MSNDIFTRWLILIWPMVIIVIIGVIYLWALLSSRTAAASLTMGVAKPHSAQQWPSQDTKCRITIREFQHIRERLNQPTSSHHSIALNTSSPNVLTMCWPIFDNYVNEDFLFLCLHDLPREILGMGVTLTYSSSLQPGGENTSRRKASLCVVNGLLTKAGSH